MASWLVPAMRMSNIIRYLVWIVMINPITQNSGFAYRQPNYIKHKKTTLFWLRLWAILGEVV